MNPEVLIADYLNEKHGVDIIYLLDSYAKDPMGGGKPLPLHVKENLVGELAKLSYAFSLICYVDTEPAGLINCFNGFSYFSCKPLINIHDVIVLDIRHLDRGGSYALIVVENIAKEKGCCKLTLEVLEGNYAAKNSYLKYGFAGYELDPKMGKALFWQKAIENT